LASRILLLCLAVFLPALLIPPTDAHRTARTLLLTISFVATAASAVWWLIQRDRGRRLARLRAGENVLARWTIDAARWEWFRGLSAEWDTRAGVRPNDVDLTQTPGGNGIDVVVTRDAILIGEDFKTLERDVRITVHADWMEFHEVIPKADGVPLHTVVRLPLQPGQEAAASEVQQGFQRAYTAAGVGRGMLLIVALCCLVGVPALAGLAWFVLNATGWVR
jgi:hypothetical protein